jgi:prepilin signal peptidase PulO-like enzyme (type II secretory pathway)
MDYLQDAQGEIVQVGDCHSRAVMLESTTGRAGVMLILMQALTVRVEKHMGTLGAEGTVTEAGVVVVTELGTVVEAEFRGKHLTDAFTIPILLLLFYYSNNIILLVYCNTRMYVCIYSHNSIRSS